ncbi:hypothetical protein GGR51DRAFT_435766 [Nemania sp. FL0031]|nr:hypothetical protein GGR51DRAFT_435766 [Nemania sp. FL0031]
MATSAISAAARFASIEELLLLLSDYVNDQGTLWSLCLSNWRFNCVFTPKLSEHVTVRIEKDDERSTVERIIDGLVTGPYLQDLRHLELHINNGPEFPEWTLELITRLLKEAPNLKIFTWETSDGDVPVSTLLHLSRHSPGLEELHLRSGPELNNYGTGFRDTLERPSFPRVRVFTCRSMGTWHALYIVNQCANLERVEMTHMGYMLALGWVHSGYHAHLRALMAREEATRSQRAKVDNDDSEGNEDPGREGKGKYNRPLKMDMCYSRSPKADYDCEVCKSPGMRCWKEDDERYQEVWPWATGRARQFLQDGQVRHITYEYPHPAPEETAPFPADW